MWEPRRFKFGRRPPGFGPHVSGYSCASAAFLLFLHRGEDPMCSLAVSDLLGGFQFYWDAKWDLSLLSYFLRMLMAEAVS